MKINKVFCGHNFRVESENECIIHFFGLVTREEIDKYLGKELPNGSCELEELARNRAKPYGGYKYTKKNYPCAIVFDLPAEEGYKHVMKMIKELSEEV